MGTDEDDRDPNWFDSEPYGDRLCECPCGHQAELMPEEDGWCQNCLEGRHEAAIPSR